MKKKVQAEARQLWARPALQNNYIELEGTGGDGKAQINRTDLNFSNLAVSLINMREWT